MSPSADRAGTGSAVFGDGARRDLCPCGSSLAYDRCCGPLHRGEALAGTAEELMRSRYAAYARGLPDHLLATWHPSTRPSSLALDPALEWVRLEVLGCRAGGTGDTEGEVEFTAYYRDGHRSGRLAFLHERSRFARRGGRWLYVDGLVD